METRKRKRRKKRARRRQQLRLLFFVTLVMVVIVGIYCVNAFRSASQQNYEPMTDTTHATTVETTTAAMVSATGTADIESIVVEYHGKGINSGDYIDKNDIKVYAKGKDGSTKEVDSWNCDTLDKPLTQGENKLVISCGGVTGVLTVNTADNPEQHGDIVSVTPLDQKPELSTGCEITSLTVVLNYYGFDVDKCTLSDRYLKKGPVGQTDFRLAFVGDPRDGNSYGCYAPVIKDTAEKYLREQNSDMKVTDATGTDFSELKQYLDRQVPVIVWGTRYCEQGHYSVTWNVDGKELTWYTPEHCMVLVGCDDSKVTVADPLEGDFMEYDRAIFEDRYNTLGKQAVVIE